VLEDGLVRARIVFDLDTRVPLLTEIFDGEGELFRYSAMIDFDSNPSLRYADLAPTAGEYDVMLPAESATMPPTAAGYVRADTYGGPDTTVQTFYTDGLFKFSIFEIVGDASPERFEAAGVLEVNEATYLQLVTPSELWVMWSAAGSTYVLVGDLPPDHLALVLAELPQPDGDGLFNRIWHGIFG
jgi:negative regulator of sigma E activity